MSKFEIQPFFFPTTAVFVDDSADFLSNISLQLNERLAFRLFKSPSAAMNALDGTNAVPHPVQSFFSFCKRQQAEDAGLKHRMIRLGLDSIHKTVHNKRRFEQVSVAVVDFDMPVMNGLEFCRNIENPAIRKILLTGKADERTAVNAFNDGIIDCFILKQDKDAIPALNRAISRMQKLYFSDIERTLSEILALDTHTSASSYGFLHDPVFAKCFAQLCDSLDIVEYYLCCAPDGILMMSASGTPYFLNVLPHAQWLAQQEKGARASEAYKMPPELPGISSNGQPVQHCSETTVAYMAAAQEWYVCRHPADVFGSHNSYVYSVVENPPGFSFESVLGYEKYLRRFDENELSRS